MYRRGEKLGSHISIAPMFFIHGDYLTFDLNKHDQWIEFFSTISQ